MAGTQTYTAADNVHTHVTSMDHLAQLPLDTVDSFRPDMTEFSVSGAGQMVSILRFARLFCLSALRYLLVVFRGSTQLGLNLEESRDLVLAS